MLADDLQKMTEDAQRAKAELLKERITSFWECTIVPALKKEAARGGFFYNTRHTDVVGLIPTEYKLENGLDARMVDNLLTIAE